MTAMKRFLDKIMLLDLFAGLGITAKNMMKKKVTVQYPEERCIKCTLCAKDCPIDIIYIDVSQQVNPETNKKEKVLDRFDIDVQRCMFCGLCEEGCPTEPKSIWLTTKTYELASYDRWDNLYVDKAELQDWRVRPAYTDEEIA